MLRPLNDKVILKKEKAVNKTASGILLSSKEVDDDAIATVIAVGDGIYEDGKLIPMNVKANDRVIFKKYSTSEFKYQDETYLVIAMKDILAVIEED